MFTEGVGREDDEDELIIGKKSGTGLRMSSIQFDLAELLNKQKNENIWIYESNIFLTVKGSSQGSDPWKSQITELRALAVDPQDVSISSGQLTSEQNLEEKTGEFGEITDEPRRKHKKIYTDFTETIQSWISPFNKDKNKVNHGVALVNTYTDGSSERTNAKDVIYAGYTNSTDMEDYIPWIDVCYKSVEIPGCTPPYEEVRVDVVSATVVVKGEDGNRNNETLTHGQDPSGKIYRTVIKFNLDQFSNRFKSYDVDQSYIHLNYLGPSEGSANDQKDRTVNVYKILEDWDEDTVSWDSVKYEDTPSGSILIEKERLGGTDVIIPIHDLAKFWIGKGVDGVNFGVILIDENQDFSSLIPQYVDDDDSDPNHYHPELSICQKTIVTSQPTSPIPTTTPPTQTTKIVTQTTPIVGKKEGCARKIKTPVDVITVKVEKNTNKTVKPDEFDGETETCISSEPIEESYCWDLAGICKKAQRRNIYGKIETECHCCLPHVEKGEPKTFNCYGTSGERRTIELQLEIILSCDCMECSRERGGNTNAGGNDVLENVGKRSVELSAGDNLYLSPYKL